MPQFRSKGKGKNRTVYPVDPRKRYVHGRVYHVKKVYHTKDKRPVAGYFTDIKGEVHPIQGESKAEVESFRKVEEAKTINTPNTKVISGVKMNEPKTYPNGITFEEAEEYKQALVSGKAIYATGNTTQLDNKIVFSNNTLNVYTKEDDGWKFTRQFASDATAKNLFGVMVKTEKRTFTIKEKQNAQIKIVKKGSKWAPIVNGKIYKALPAVKVAIASEAFTLVFNKQTVDAPETFWTELDNASAQGGID